MIEKYIKNSDLIDLLEENVRWSKEFKAKYPGDKTAKIYYKGRIDQCQELADELDLDINV